MNGLGLCCLRARYVQDLAAHGSVDAKTPANTKKHKFALLGQLRDRRLLAEVVNSLFRHGFLISPKDYSMVIHALARQAFWRDSLATMKTMFDAGHDGDNVVYNIAISALEKVEEWPKAFGLLRDMPGRDVQKDVVTYSAIVRALHVGQQWRMALECYHQSSAACVEPNVIACSSVLIAVGGSRDWNLACQLFLDLQRAGLKLDTILCNAFVGVFDTSQLWDRALWMLYTMDVRPDAVTYNICAAQNRQSWETSFAVLFHARHVGLEPFLYY